MAQEMKWNGRAVIALLCVALAIAFALNVVYTGTSASYYNDNTSIITRLNVTNRAPVVKNVNLYDSNAPGNMILEQGTVHRVVCNATVNDTNGFNDISGVNATLFKHSEYGPASADDNNYKYSNSTCNRYTTANIIQGFYTCQFDVEYYAYNGTLRCNVTAIDLSDARNSSTDNNIIDPLFAINLSNTELDFGELEPLNTSLDKILNITNFGNANLTIAVRAYGETVGDGWAMNCSTGNISQTYERYSINSGQAWAGMTSVGSTFANIAGLTVYQRVNDMDTAMLESTNTTFWKIKAPLGTKGVCNGTLELSAVNPN
jgi:hypothetical protein